MIELFHFGASRRLPLPCTDAFLAMNCASTLDCPPLPVNTMVAFGVKTIPSSVRVADPAKPWSLELSDQSARLANRPSSGAVQIIDPEPPPSFSSDVGLRKSALGRIFDSTDDVPGFEIETFINVRVLKAQLEIREVPSIEYRRIEGVSNLNAFLDGLRILRVITKERFGRKRLVKEMQVKGRGNL